MTGHLTLVSFGFKYGTPPQCGWLSDARGLRNPYYDFNLRKLTGLDKAVRDYAMEGSAWTEIFAELTRVIDTVDMPYTIAVGCTGGQHRSVTVVEELSRWAHDQGYMVTTRHREID